MTAALIKVQIPQDVYDAIRPYFMMVDLGDLQNFVDWAVDLYRETKSPGVQYMLGDLHLPDAYGYLYTYYIVQQAINKVK